MYRIGTDSTDFWIGHSLQLLARARTATSHKNMELLSNLSFSTKWLVVLHTGMQLPNNAANRRSICSYLLTSAYVQTHMTCKRQYKEAASLAGLVIALWIAEEMLWQPLFIAVQILRVILLLHRNSRLSHCWINWGGPWTDDCAQRTRGWRQRYHVKSLQLTKSALKRGLHMAAHSSIRPRRRRQSNRKSPLVWLSLQSPSPVPQSCTLRHSITLLSFNLPARNADIIPVNTYTLFSCLLITNYIYIYIYIYIQCVSRL